MLKLCDQLPPLPLVRTDKRTLISDIALRQTKKTKLTDQLPNSPDCPSTKLADQLPNSPDCPSFISWYLDTNYVLAAIPPLFFDRILLLQELDLSNTNIKSLPKCLPKLVALKKLCLRHCKLFMELSPQVGKLENLEELDLDDETQIMDLPTEIGKLVRLKRLRVSFYGLVSKKRLQSNIVIRPGTISNLSQLIELSIDVDPADKRWDDSVEAVVKEVCKLKLLTSLSLYLPRVQLLDEYCSTNCKSLMNPSLSQFRFIVGYQKRRIISRVPDEVEAEFRNSEKSLKFMNGGNIPIGIKLVLRYSTSFFLDNHATALNLSEFGIENMKRLKFCLLSECNQMETIIDVQSHLYDGDKNSDQAEVNPRSSSAKQVLLESLQHLSIYYMKNLGSIWKGPVGFGGFSKLKFLALHTCPKLSIIFPHAMVENFVNLEELIVEDCPGVTSLISYSVATINFRANNLLPSLKRLLLLYLPELVTISNGLLIAPKLESIGFYSCPRFKNISKQELSSKNLKRIKGESEWWADIKWNETERGTGGADYLMRIFSPISKDRDVMTQLLDDKDMFDASIKCNEQPGKVEMTKCLQQQDSFSSDNRNRKINDRKSIERQRRQAFLSLYNSLRNLLPPVKGERSVSDMLARARSYILLLQKRVNELRGLRDEYQIKEEFLSDLVDSKLTSFDHDQDYSSSCVVEDYSSSSIVDDFSSSCCVVEEDDSSSCVVVRPYEYDGVEVVLRPGLSGGRNFTLSRVLQLLLDEELEVVSCISSTLDGRLIHSIQSKVSHSLTCDISVLQQKLEAEVS